MSESTEERMRLAITNLYHVFAFIKKPPCPLGDSLASYTRQQLHDQETKQLRDFTVKEMDDYAWHSITLAGTSIAIQYWLPRLLDVFTYRDKDTDSTSGVFDIDFILSNVNSVSWRNWPDIQQRAVEEWFMSWWLMCLDYSPTNARNYWALENCSVGRCLQLSMEAGIPIAPLLTIWRQRQDLPAMVQLAHLVMSFVNGISSKKPQVESWDALTSPVGKWLFSQDTLAQLEQASSAVIRLAVESHDVHEIKLAEQMSGDIDSAMSYLQAFLETM